MSHTATLLAALLAEAALGYPRRWPHPVNAAAALIDRHARRFNHGPPPRRRRAGVALALLLAGSAALAGVAIEQAAAALPGQAWGSVVVVAVATTALAQRSLDDHVAAVLRPLVAGDLPRARAAVAMIVGRDTATLDEGGIATAAIESLAESFCDGVVAPAFFFLLFGLPGLFAAKAINTADSIVGHRTPALADYGRACARADDAVNFLPARIAAALLCLVAGPVRGAAGWRVMRRDARLHASPNGGWPEAAMAGALGRRLGGPVCYDGEPAARARLGDGPAPAAADLRRALWLYRRACVALWLAVGALAGGLAWLR